MIKRIAASLVAALTLGAPTALAQFVTLTGSLQSTNGMPASNYSISFTPSQFGYVAGTGVFVNTSTNCATSVDGSVVGIPNPLSAPPVTVGFTGTLTPGNYFVKYAFYDASGNLTLVSPETVIQLNSTGQLIVVSPTSGMPAGSVGMKVFISASTNAETLQGQTTGSAAFIQSVPLTSGAAVPPTNTTVCKQVANDAIWPSGTGYTVALTDPSGNTLPGYPMQWQLMGPNSTINLSSGLPYYHGTVFFPTPILASPINHGLQSISGPLSLSGFPLQDVSTLGIGTNLPAWPLDVENGSINASGGYLANGSGGTTGQCLGSNGTSFNVPINCLTSVGTINYQLVQANGVPLPQAPILNFNNGLVASGSTAATNVGMATLGAGGSCTFCSVTFDTFGRVTASSSGNSVPITRTPHNVTSSRAFGTNFQNTSGTEMLVSGNGSEIGSGEGTLTCAVGTTNPASQQVWGLVYTATVDLAPAGFACTVPIDDWYRIDMTGNIHPISFGGGANWVEYF